MRKEQRIKNKEQRAKEGGKYRYAILCSFIFALCSFVLGCSDILAPPAAAVNDTQQGLFITVSNGEQAAKTLYPNKNFTKYVLSFEDNFATYGNVTITGKNSILIEDIPDGSWTISAKGYVSINGTEYEAASGLDYVTVSSGSFTSATITIRAAQSGADGYFSWDISYPSATELNSATLQIEGLGSSSYSNSIDLLSPPIDAFITLSPGYYLARIQLETGSQIAGRTEIVHIYSNMETNWEYAFTGDNFSNAIVLSGTVSILINGVPPDEVWVNASVYDDGKGGSYQVGRARADPNDNYSWSMAFEPFDTPTVLDFYVEYGSGSDLRSKHAGRETVSDQSMTINLDSINLSIITLGGTANVTVNGIQLPTYATVWLSAYFDNGDWREYVGSTWVDSENGNTWSMDIEPFNQPTTVYFEVEVYDNGDNIRKTAGSVNNVQSNSINNINLSVNIQTFIIYGTVSVTVNGKTLQDFNLEVYDEDGEWLGDANFYNSTTDGTSWSITILAPDTTPATLYFSINAYDDNYTGNIRNVHNITPTTNDWNNGKCFDVDIVVNETASTLSGTVNLSDAYIAALNTSVSSLEELFESLDQVAGEAEAYSTGGSSSWSMDIIGTMPALLWFVVIDWETGEAYITTSALNTSNQVLLNTAAGGNMTYLGTIEPDGGSGDPDGKG